MHQYAIGFAGLLFLASCATPSPPAPQAANIYAPSLPEPPVVRAPEIEAPPVVARTTPASRTARSSTSRRYYMGPRGGCYYLTGSGNRQYVDRSYCR